LAELSTMRLPSILIPYPTATDDHQFHNALAYSVSGAARLLLEPEASPEHLQQFLQELILSDPVRQNMREALARWDRPNVAKQIAENIVQAIASGVRPSRAQELAPAPEPSLIQASPVYGDCCARDGRTPA